METNPQDGAFLKYIPDSMLTTEQLAGKNEALDKDNQKIDKLKNENNKQGKNNRQPAFAEGTDAAQSGGYHDLYV
ncbi:MAG: hypothetical protein IKQ41_00315 [Clostridia bacterium]|nr:hypothetical protein [Clostridia bacterium]